MHIPIGLKLLIIHIGGMIIGEYFIRIFLIRDKLSGKSREQLSENLLFETLIHTITSRKRKV